MLQSERAAPLQRGQWAPLPTDPSRAAAPAGHSDVSQTRGEELTSVTETEGLDSKCHWVQL